MAFSRFSMGSSYKPWLTILLLYIIVGLQKTQVATTHSPTKECIHYHGACNSYFLNSTEHRFINTTLGFNATENIAIRFLDFSGKTYKTKPDKTCEAIVNQTICFFLFPYCSMEHKKLDYCREDCNYLFEICGGDISLIVGAGKALLQNKLPAKIFRFDSCKDFKSSKEDFGNDSCRHLPFIKIPPKMSKTKELDKGVIITIAVLVPLSVFILVLCAIHHRRMTKKARLNSILYEPGKEETGVNKDRLSNVVSMRDRIREWKVAPSELVELVDICKSRGVLEIPVDDIEYLKDLGSGQYGLVFQGKVIEDIDGETSSIVAVKTLREGSSQEAIKEFCQEVNIMSTFSHPNVVKLIGVSLTGEPYCMIFEFVEFGDLASFLRNCDEFAEDANSAYPKITVTDQLAIAVQVASGMKYISSIRCVHRDLAARNCLVGRGLVVKISDFGLSRDVYVSEYYRMDKTRMLPVRWLPPEAFVDGKFTTYSDVYSYGVLLWEVFTFAMLPYNDHDNNKAMELILEGVLLEKPDICPRPVYDIMLKCWDADPEKRILFPEIINELCSLDDFGQRFEAKEEQILENFKARSLSNSSKMAEDRLPSYTNQSCNRDDEQPINVERLSPQPITMAPSSHYSKPPCNKAQSETAKKAGYDGFVTLPKSVNDVPADERNRSEGLRAVHDFTPPEISYGKDDDSAPIYGNFESAPIYSNVDVDDEESAPIYGNVDPYDVNDPNDSGETYDVPPKLEDEETYSVPPVPRKGYDADSQETYDVPPKAPADGSEETYDVPPKQGDEPEETYDVPPKSNEYPDEPQETYDVPPGLMKIPLIKQDGMLTEGEETYDVPPRPEKNEIYQNSLPVKAKTEHYSVPQSPYLKRKNENRNNENPSQNLSSPSRGERRSYENVDFDGKPLITS
ncbi:vascular endothelial growth factor receptor 2-like [Dendronephthya gigantea]|uniref:vascular endothelial growth factor receptor 2-like n=1 Tax=Dendronephthya gigantea TaxID=151771 RepID=UPI00106D2744|nr:vascular endothelial growth factor receptor 2-like [Dendronephthya gigantea]